MIFPRLYLKTTVSLRRKVQDSGELPSAFNLQPSAKLPRAQRLEPRAPRAFTLVELMIVAVLFVIIGAGLITTLLTGRITYASSEAYIQVQQQARRALDNMVRELREAGPPGAGGINATPAAVPPRTQLHFQKAKSFDPVGCSGTNGICWGNDAAVGGWVHYVFVPNAAQPNNNQLIRCENTVNAAVGIPLGGACAASQRVLANNVASADFKYDEPSNTVTMSLDFTYADPSIPQGQQTTGPINAQVRLRNP